MPLLLLLAFTAGVMVTVIAMQWTRGIGTAIALPGLDSANEDKLQPEKAKMNLFGLAKPSIKKATWEYSSQFNKSFTASNYGVDLEVFISNPTTSPINCFLQ